MKAYWEVDVYVHIFFTSVVVGGEWSASRLFLFTPREGAPGTHWIEDRVDPRAGLDDVKKRYFLIQPGLEFSPLGRSQSLYRLLYPVS
jgi:hypothetical protein